MIDLHTITAMAAYAAKSPEELRLEDYNAPKSSHGLFGSSTPDVPTAPASGFRAAAQVFGANVLSLGSQASAPPAAGGGSLLAGGGGRCPFGAAAAPPAPTFGSNNVGRGNTSTSYPGLFGSSAPIPPPPSSGIGGFGVSTFPAASPSSAAVGTTPHVLTYFAPLRLASLTCDYDVVGTTEIMEDCAICLDVLSTHEAVKLKKCGHNFHKHCIQHAVSLRNECPICRYVVGEPQGRMPSGKMTITTSTDECQGYACGTIIIKYRIPSGVQAIYMQNPGHSFTGIKRRAYLPDNNNGRKLLKRLEFAFTRGLTFVVGTSLTTGQQNVVTWASVHHKTSMRGGLGCHGYPDASYFPNVNEELDNLGVPSAEDC